MFKTESGCHAFFGWFLLFLDVKWKGRVPSSAVLITSFFTPSDWLQIVAGRENAREVVKILMDNPDVFFGCDTEVAELDLKVRRYADGSC